jgi:hypothetical protein
MNILSFLQAHLVQLGALLIAIFAVGTAKKIIPFAQRANNKERSPHARWAAFVLYAIGGLALAVTMVPLIRWLVALGSRSGLTALVGNVSAIAFLALGWHAIAMIVTMIRDLADKTPDHEARTAALWVPTLLPIGGAAVFQLLRNPQGIGQGLTAAIMGVITLVYVFMIVKRADSASNHKNQWSWFSFGVMILGGLVIIPMLAYVDTALISKLPGSIATLFRVGLGLSALGAIVAGIFDIWCDGVPNKFARTAAIWGLGGVLIFGSLAVATLFGSTATGASFLSGVF